MIKMEEYITTEFISKELHKSLRTVQHWIKSGQLPASRLGRNYLIKVRDYREFKSRFKLSA